MRIYQPTRTVPYTTAYNHTPGDSIWGSKYLITGCVVLWGGDIQRTPVVNWVFFGRFGRASPEWYTIGNVI